MLLSQLGFIFSSTSYSNCFSYAERERPVGDSVPAFNQQIRSQIQNGMVDASEEMQYSATSRSDAVSFSLDHYVLQLTGESFASNIEKFATASHLAELLQRETMKMGSKLYNSVPKYSSELAVELESVVGTVCIAAYCHALLFGDCLPHTPFILSYMLMLIVVLKYSSS